jgi:hypothetical protein
MSRLPVVGAALTALACAAAPSAAIDMQPIWLGTPFLEGWVPETGKPIRGVLVLDGWPMDGRWTEAARYWNFAILRINSDKYGSDLPSDAAHAPLAQGNIKASAVKQGLHRLAELTGHRELGWVPIVSSGFSRYSGPAASYMTAFPKRALCFLNGNGGGGDPGASDARGQLLWRRTPSQGLQCEWENIFEGGAKTKLLPRWWRRPAGNLTMAGITWRVYHSPKTFADLGIVFVDQVIQARIPEDWDPRSGPAKLRELKEADGWLGSHEGWRVPVEKIFETGNENAQIAPFSEFKGDRERSSWLVSEELAWVWRAFSSRYPKARIVAPGHSNLALHQDPGPAPVGHLECGVRAGVPFRAAAQVDVSDMAGIEFFANSRSLGRSSTFRGAQMAIGSTKDAVVEVEATIPEAGIYGLMGRCTTTEGTTGWTRPMPLVVWPH